MKHNGLMVKIIGFTLLITGITQNCVVCFAQADPINWNAIKPETLPIDSMVKMAVGFMEAEDPQAAIKIYKLAAAEATKIKDYYRQTDNMYEQGNAWLAAKQPDSALYYFSWAYGNSLKQQDLNLYAYALNSLVELHNNKGEVNKALNLIAESDSLLPTLKGNPINLAMSYSNIGVFFSNKGLQERGLQYYIKAFNSVKELKDTSRMYPMLMNIACYLLSILLKTAFWQGVF